VECPFPVEDSLLSSLSSPTHPLSAPPMPPSHVFAWKVEVDRLGDCYIPEILNQIS
jgi:hypothetical protein